MEGKKRSAVLVGCNYPSTRYELRGCINDVLAMREALVNCFGFDQSDIEVLTDESGSLVMPTGANIRKALDNMVKKAKEGDVLFFHYSGHGTRIPSLKPGNPLRQDEAIVPCDFNLITDVDFRHLVNRLPNGASFTMLSDSCHSGGLIDKEKEQIGPSKFTSNTPIISTSTSTPKTIPFESILQHLTTLTNINTSDIGTHFLELFGANASLRFHLNPFDLADPLKIKDDEGILLSGCQANETSADMNPSADDDDEAGANKAYGAFSHAVQIVFKENLGMALSNKQVVIMAGEVLKQQGLAAQHPCLYSSDRNADASFLGRLS